MPDRIAYPVVNYAIDAYDHLIEINQAWTQFAEDNEAGQSLRPESVLGQSLWKFIRDESLQELYRQLILTVRETQQEALFDFRCDSPRFRRFMRMTMLPRPDGVVQFRSETREVRPRTEDLRAAAAFTGSSHIMRCSVCNLYKFPNGQWMELAEAVATTQALATDQRPRLLWSICPNCRGNLSPGSRSQS